MPDWMDAVLFERLAWMGPTGLIALTLVLGAVRRFIVSARKPPAEPVHKYDKPAVEVTQEIPTHTPADFADLDQEARAYGHYTPKPAAVTATGPHDLAALAPLVRAEAERLAREHLVPRKVPEFEAASAATGVAAQAVADAYVVWVGQVAVEALARAAKAPPL